MYHRVEIVLRVFLSACLTLVMRDRSLPRQRSPYPPMGVCAIVAWLVRYMWLGVLANKIKMLCKSTTLEVVPRQLAK